MNPKVPQSLKDQILKEGDPVFDFNFCNDRRVNTGLFHTTFTMKDNSQKEAGYKRLEWELQDKREFFN